jgi:hypothetical protein
MSSPEELTLITLDKAKRQLSMTHDLDDETIFEKCLQAEAIVYDYIEQEAGFWSDESPPDLSNPPQVLIAAALMVVAALYENREGFDGGPASSSVSQAEPLGRAAKNLLTRFRTPAVG